MSPRQRTIFVVSLFYLTIFAPLTALTYLAYVEAIAAPGRGNTVEPGSAADICRWTIYADGSSYLAKDGQQGGNIASNTDFDVLVQGRLDSGTGQVCLEGMTATYDTTLTLGTGDSLIGAGTALTTLSFTGTTTPAIRAQGTVGTPLSNIRIIDLTVDGDGISRTGVYGLHLRHVTNPFFVERVKITEMGDWGLFLDGGVYTVQFNRLIIAGNLGGAINLNVADALFPNSNVFLHPHISGHNVATVVFITSSSESNTFIAPHFESNTMSTALVRIATSAIYNRFESVEAIDNTYTGGVPMFNLAGASLGTQIIGGTLEQSLASSAAVLIEGTSDFNIISGLYLTGNSNVAASITSSGTANRVENIVRSGGVTGITKNQGSATIVASTTVIVTHNLALTPTVVTVTSRSTGYGTIAVTARGATTFTITVTTSGTYTVDWDANTY